MPVLDTKTVVSYLNKGQPHNLKNNKIFLIEIPDNYTPPPNSEKAPDTKKWTPSRKADFKFYTEILEKLPNEQILIDLGCGHGRFRSLLTKFKYIGIDIYPYDVVGIVADFTKPMPLKEACCDVVVISNVLEHTHEPRILVQEAYRLLRPGGILLGSVPFFAHVHEEPYDFLRYTYIMLEKIFSEAGFVNPKVEPLETMADFYNWFWLRFFKRAMREKLPIWKRPLLKLARLSILALMKLWSPIFANMTPSKQFSRRYGFVAIKPTNN